MIKRNMLNNIIMGNKRKDHTYQTVITDLALAGIIPRDKAEKLLGYKIPSYLKLEDGTHFDDDTDKKETKKEKVKKDSLAEGLGL